MKRLTEYSKDLGMSRANLGVYAINRGFPKKTPPFKIYEAYQKELRNQFQTRNRLNEIYYELREKRGDTTLFARFLVSKRIIVSEKSFRRILEHSFMNLNARLIGCQHAKRHIDILEAYEEWKHGSNHSTSISC